MIGLVHEVQRLANSSPKHSAQYGFSSLEVNRCPASEVLQWVHVKHSRCQGSFLYVTPPWVIICKSTKMPFMPSGFLLSFFTNIDIYIDKKKHKYKGKIDLKMKRLKLWRYYDILNAYVKQTDVIFQRLFITCGKDILTGCCLF